MYCPIDTHQVVESFALSGRCYTSIAIIPRTLPWANSSLPLRGDIEQWDLQNSYLHIYTTQERNQPTTTERVEDKYQTSTEQVPSKYLLTVKGVALYNELTKGE